MFEMTLSELNAAKQKAFNELVEEAGNLNHLARMLNVDTNLIKGWAKRGQVSKSGARLIEAHPTLGLKFKANMLRPDL